MKKFKKFALYAGLTTMGFAMLLFPKRTSAQVGDATVYEIISVQSMGKPKTTMEKINDLETLKTLLNNQMKSFNSEEVKIESGGGDGEETQTLPDGTSSVIIKQGNGTVVVWTETPLPDINQYRTDYLATEGRDPSIKSDDSFVPITGYGTHELNPVLGNPWKTYTFGVDPTTGKPYFSANGDAYSHINAQTSPTPTPTFKPTPTPTDPNATPTPTDPNATPTPTDPNQTPNPTPTNYYPQTGDNSYGNSMGYGVLTFITFGAAAVGYVLIKRKKAKQGY